jgi:archaellum component FlaC
MVIADRLPQLIRRVSLPSEAELLAEKLPTITEEFSRTVAFYNSSHLEKPLDSTVPVFVCGELAEAPETWQSIVGRLNSPVSPLPSPVESPEAFSPNEFMVNIGLALKELLPEKGEDNFSLVNLNTLPKVYLPKALPMARILTPIGIAVGIGILVFMGFLIQNSAADTTELRSELALTESHIAQQEEEIATLKEQIEQVETQIESVAVEVELVEAEVELVEATTGVFKATFTSLEEVREEVNADLAQVVILTQGTVELTGVNHGGSSVTVNGIAPQEGDIFRYARDLRSGGRFPLVIISSIAEYTKEVEEEEIKAFSFVFLLK